MRARDALGRPLPAGDPRAVEQVPEQALPPAEALTFAQQLLDQGRAFSAHEVLEASWKAAPTGERDLWQGLAQVCVGLTHLQRGNRVGAVRLLRRGAGRLAGSPEVAAHGIAAGAVREFARTLADRVEADRVEADQVEADQAEQDEQADQADQADQAEQGEQDEQAEQDERPRQEEQRRPDGPPRQDGQAQNQHGQHPRRGPALPSDLDAVPTLRQP